MTLWAEYCATKLFLVSVTRLLRRNCWTNRNLLTNKPSNWLKVPKGQQEMRTPSKPTDSADPVQNAGTSPSVKGIVCHRCARPGHLPTVCCLKDKVCHKAISRERTGAKSHRAPGTRRRNVHHVEEPVSSDDSNYSVIDSLSTPWETAREVSVMHPLL